MENQFFGTFGFILFCLNDFVTKIEIYSEMGEFSNAIKET